MVKDSNADAKISSPYVKFLIGVLAGCAVVAIPRLSSFLVSESSGGVEFDYFPTNYIISIIIFSLFLGLIIMILEYKLPKTPKETFFAALAIPGLIAGSLNTAIESNDANEKFQEVIELRQEVLRNNDISIEQIDSLEIIPMSLPETSTEKIDLSLNFTFQLIKNAHAEETEKTLLKQNESMSLSVQRDTASFAISVGQYQNKAEAIEKAIELKKIIPSITLIKTKKGYELLSNRKLLSETEATLRAAKIRHDLNIKPKILKIK